MEIDNGVQQKFPTCIAMSRCCRIECSTHLPLVHEVARGDSFIFAFLDTGWDISKSYARSLIGIGPKNRMEKFYDKKTKKTTTKRIAPFLGEIEIAQFFKISGDVT